MTETTLWRNYQRHHKKEILEGYYYKTSKRQKKNQTIKLTKDLAELDFFYYFLLC